MGPAGADTIEESAFPADTVPGTDGIPDERTVEMPQRPDASRLLRDTHAGLAGLLVLLYRHTGRIDPLLGVSPDGTAPFAPLHLVLDPAEPFAALLARLAGAGTADPADGAAHVADGPDAAPDAADPWRPAVGYHGAGPADQLPLPEGGVRLSVHPDQDRTVTRLRYDAARITEATATCLLRDHANLLDQAAARPDTPVRELRLRPDLPPPVAWALPVPPGYRPAPAPGPDETLVRRFDTVAAEHPDRTAVRGGAGELTYRQLSCASRSTARRLAERCGPGDRVALLCEHDLGAVTGVWSVLRTGAAYVPLDSRQPDGRLARLLAESRATALLCDAALAPRATALAKGRPVFVLEPADPDPKAADDTDAAADDANAAPADPDAPAYLLYTSGTTGSPKAVVQSGANVLRHALGYAERLRIGPHTPAVPMLARCTVDAGVMDLYGALLTGSTLILLDPMVQPDRARRALADSSAPLLHCTPTFFRHLLSDLGAGDGPVPELRAIDTVVLGGEEVSGADLALFRRCFPARSHLVNGLGPSECTLALQHLCTPADLDRLSVPVGHPVPGVDVVLLDPEGLPTEAYGELEYRSERVALGYWDQPGPTTAAFGEAPDGVRSFRTGDLARRLADGTLLFRGRRDRQVKIRGHRVEPGEAEALLRAHPTVAQAVVVVGGTQVEPQLVGYVTACTASAPEEDELLDYLGRVLPEHAVPARIVPLDELPTGPSGKLDHRRLPPPPGRTANDEVPMTALELTVAQQWCAVLGIERIDLHTGFMTAGGDSIRLLALLGRLKQHTGADVPLVEFLRRPTVAAVAALIEKTGPHRMEAHR